MSKRKIVFVFVGLLIFVGGILGILAGYGWFLKKQARVLAGTASPKFPYADYSLNELNSLYPQYLEVATTQTPEETYAKFIDCLKKEDVECAVEWVAVKEKDRYRSSTNKFIEENRLQEKVKNLDVTIVMSDGGDLGDRRFYKSGDGEIEIVFLKDLQGVWRIESL